MKIVVRQQRNGEWIWEIYESINGTNKITVKSINGFPRASDATESVTTYLRNTHK